MTKKSLNHKYAGKLMLIVASMVALTKMPSCGGSGTEPAISDAPTTASSTSEFYLKHYKQECKDDGD